MPSTDQLLHVRRIHLVEATAPPVPPWERAAMDRIWDEAVRAGPSLFDGPVAACAGLAEDGSRGLVLTWVRTTYRRYGLRRVPGATACVASLYTDVLQPTPDGRLLVGRMAASTAAPGRWQLPGGAVEPPPEGVPLDLAALRRNAARELAEETGVTQLPEDLALWGVARGPYGSAGVLFLAPARPPAHLRGRFADLASAEEARGREPELDRIAFVGSPAGLARLGGAGADRADCLEPVVARFTAGAGLSRASRDGG
ncbi:NUDIX hydrolase [Streptomyces silvensis]|uniref:NUDIX hydrolase n=1 Tax=Streptomyces silvensis TaxID=1765722 RepID=A0A0W7X500_9ACTN|nr:NUDIX domain-containing protein [Streptomyces silvensis]KUF17964.1 NUDIX hydrolase [Streptomyces silvensis]